VFTVILRCTSKALRLLGADATVRRDLPPGVDDWYLNLLWLRGRKSLLLVHVGTLFPVLMWDVRLRELRPIGPYVVSQIEAALRDEGLPADWFGDLIAEPVLIARTADRQILGFMNDMAHTADYWAADDGPRSSNGVSAINRDLRRGLHNRGGKYVSPMGLVKAWDVGRA
jgi:hypothetical protein